MTTPRCKACNHPHRSQIDLEIVKGVSERHLAGLFPGVTRSGFARHKKHIGQELKRAREANRAVDKAPTGPLADSPGSVGSPVGSIVAPPSADPVNVVEQIGKFLPVLRGIVGRSMESRQYFAAVAASREYRETLKLIAQLDGSLALNRARPADEPLRLKDLTDEQLAALVAEALNTVEE